MKEHILLVNPWIYDFTAHDLWMKPLGLLYLASHFRLAGYEVSFFDCMNRNDPDMPLSENPGPRRLREYGCGGYFREICTKPIQLERIPRYWSRFGIPWDRVRTQLEHMAPPDWVLITCTMTYWYPGAVAFLNLVRQLWGKTKVMIGGWYPTLCPEHARQWGFDQVVTGVEPLIVMDELHALFDSLRQVNDYEDYFAVKPAFDLYSSLNYTVVLTSVGCPFRCSYCASGRYFPAFWRRPWQEVFKEILCDVYEYGVNNIAFYDDALLYRAEEGFIPLLRQLKKENLPVHFHLPNSIHVCYLTQEIAELMKECQFKTIRLSLEFADSKSQQTTGNKVNNTLFEQAVAHFIRAGYSPDDLEVYLLFGHPGVDPNDHISSFRYVSNLGLKPRLSLYSPLPGTPDFDHSPLLPVREEPLYQNKIAYLYLTGQYPLYEKLQTQKMNTG